MKAGIAGNRAKINYMSLCWDKARDTLVGDYAKKNTGKRKGEFKEIIGDIHGIPMEVRDHFLTRYISRCKMLSALAFF